MSWFHNIPSRRLGSNSTSHLRLLRTQACFPCADRNVTHNLAHCCYPFSNELLLILDFPGRRLASPVQLFCLGDGISLTASAYRGIRSPSRCHHKTLLLILHFPGRRLASPVQLFCLGDGISLKASAYRGIRSNANICFSLYTTPDTGLLPPSTTASAYRGVRSNANSADLLRTQACFPCADRNVTHNLAHCCYPFSKKM